MFNAFEDAGNKCPSISHLNHQDCRQVDLKSSINVPINTAVGKSPAATSLLETS